MHFLFVYYKEMRHSLLSSPVQYIVNYFAYYADILQSISIMEKFSVIGHEFRFLLQIIFLLALQLITELPED